VTLRVVVVSGVPGGPSVALPWSHQVTIHVQFTNADALAPHAGVDIAGVKVGAVDGIGDDGKGNSLVTMRINPDVKLRADTRAVCRPKSLLGEKYLDLRPGTDGSSLPAGGRTRSDRANISTDPEPVISTFDQPTREKLQTLVIELGGGVAGRGPDTNATIQAGTHDLNDRTNIANTLQQRDVELEKVIQALDDVLSQLATSERRQQLVDAGRAGQAVQPAARRGEVRGALPMEVGQKGQVGLDIGAVQGLGDAAAQPPRDQGHRAGAVEGADQG